MEPPTRKPGTRSSTEGGTEELLVRDAQEADLAALVAIKGEGSEALHRDRLGDARSGGFRYLVLSVSREVIGFACLVFRRPASWSDADSTQHLPQIVDLRVKESQRGRGYGTELIRAMERIAAAAGFQHLYLGVDPVDNPRAHALYRRLGYVALQTEPYRDSWQFYDSAGVRHQGEGWVIDMVRQLGP